MRKKHQYHFNPDTLSLEKVERSSGYWLRKTGLYLLAGILGGILFFFLFFSFFPSPREKQLAKQHEALQTQYEILNHRLDQMQLVLVDLEQRDDNLYRTLFQAEPIPLNVRLGAVRQASYYDSIADLTSSQLASDLTRKVDVIEKQVYVQAKSYEEILNLAKTQEIRMENIPAIQPVLNKDLKHVASGYGWRTDPVYHTARFHAGMDFTASTGTDVYVTGNGVVTYAGWRQGYGNCIIVDHGFNYETLYAHLNKIIALQGARVTRGDVIGLVGNTGKSTGPHLHYEVHYKGQPVDPRNFYFQDLSPEEYDKMVQLSNNFGNLLD